jgi:hypothetical protein
MIPVLTVCRDIWEECRFTISHSLRLSLFPVVLSLGNLLLLYIVDIFMFDGISLLPKCVSSLID